MSTAEQQLSRDDHQWQQQQDGRVFCALSSPAGDLGGGLRAPLTPAESSTPLQRVSLLPALNSAVSSLQIGRHDDAVQLIYREHAESVARRQASWRDRTAVQQGSQARKRALKSRAVRRLMLSCVLLPHYPATIKLARRRVRQHQQCQA